MKEYKQITFKRVSHNAGEPEELTMEARIMEDHEIVHSQRCISIESQGPVLISNETKDGKTVAEAKAAWNATDIAIIRNYDE